jgi:hypothetical protein
MGDSSTISWDDEHNEKSSSEYDSEANVVLPAPSHKIKNISSDIK